MTQKFSWIESGGGPLVFAAESVLGQWRGSDPAQNLSGPTDYERACAVTDEIGTIDITSTAALVLGDEPDRSTILMHPSGLLIVRWRWADSEDALVSALSSSNVDQIAYKGLLRFVSRCEKYFLF